MTILPPAVLTTTQLIGGLVASAKNALDIAKASSDRALKAAVSELHDSVFDVKRRVLDLDEENCRLKAELALRDEIVGPVQPHGYFFFKKRPDDPVCPNCWQSQPRNPRFLTPLHHNSSEAWRSCTGCNYIHWEVRPNLRHEQNEKLNYWE
jgi:hypothetical protein